MSELKRDISDFRFAPPDKPARAHPGIENSQPRQTLELTRALALWEGNDARGGDPYNAVGRAISHRAA